MPTRPRSPGGSGGDPPDPPSRGGPRPHSPGGVPADNIAAAQRSIQSVARRGRAGEGHNTVGAAPPPSRPSPDDLELADAMRKYDQLGADPPKFDIAENDATNPPAHTLDRHGHDIPLRRDPGQKTIEGRIHGDTGWAQATSQSFKWDNPTVMTREVNEYVQRNWERIRSDLATEGIHEANYNSGHRVGEGFINGGMYGFGPRQADYMPTSLVRMRITLVAGADPAQPFLISAFPAGTLK